MIIITLFEAIWPLFWPMRMTCTRCIGSQAQCFFRSTCEKDATAGHPMSPTPSPRKRRDGICPLETTKNKSTNDKVKESTNQAKCYAPCPFLCKNIKIRETKLGFQAVQLHSKKNDNENPKDEPCDNEQKYLQREKKSFGKSWSLDSICWVKNTETHGVDGVRSVERPTLSSTRVRVRPPCS